MAALATACTAHVFPTSRYQRHYLGQLEGFSLPPAAEIERVGLSRLYFHDLETVWDACRDIACQHEGILGLARDSEGTRRLAFIHGRSLVLEAPTGTSNAGTVEERFLDAWMAVSLRSESPGTTDVTVAWVDPFTLQALALPRTGMAGTDSLAGAPGAATDPRDEVPAFVADAFLSNLGTQLDEPAAWQRKFVRGPVKPREATIALEAAPPEEPRTRELARRGGNWQSTVFRRHHVVIRCPDVQETLEQVVRDLNRAAGRPTAEVSVHILALPIENAFALPNGEVFVCSGMLDRMQSVDELAFVLGHELDHTLQRDSANLLTTEADSAALFGAIVEGLATVGSLVIQVQSASSAVPGQIPQPSQSATTLANYMVALSPVVATEMGRVIVSGYAREQELRADANGARLMWLAGYDKQAVLSAIGRLHDVEVEALAHARHIPSAFINAEPGLDARRVELQAVLADLPD